MDRSALTGVVFSLALAGSAAADAPATKVFSFLGEDTETQSFRTSLNRSDCKIDGDTKTCVDYNAPVLAGRPMRWLSVAYYKGKLYAVSATFRDTVIADVGSALREKYGAPDRVFVEKWQARSGATFDNQIAAWRFKGGELRLERIGQELGNSKFWFLSNHNKPPTPKPNVDF